MKLAIPPIHILLHLSICYSETSKNQCSRKLYATESRILHP